jgi:membrane associated rhomboid family serine protease
MTTVTSLMEKARKPTRAQRRAALVALVGLLLLVPALPAVVMVPAAMVAVWASAQPLLVGMVLGAYVLHRRRKAGTR